MSPPLLLTAAASGAAKLDSTRVYINGLPLRSAAGGPSAAIVKDGVTCVPLRAVAESLGCTVDGACPEQARGDPKAGVFVSGGPQSPHLPGLP